MEEGREGGGRLECCSGSLPSAMCVFVHVCVCVCVYCALFCFCIPTQTARCCFSLANRDVNICYIG